LDVLSRLLTIYVFFWILCLGKDNTEDYDLNMWLYAKGRDNSSEIKTEMQLCMVSFITKYTLNLSFNF